MMLDVKKNRGFHKTPASRLQRGGEPAVVAVAAPSAAAAAGASTVAASHPGAGKVATATGTTSVASGKGAGGSKRGIHNSTARGREGRSKYSTGPGIPTGGGASVGVGKGQGKHGSSSAAGAAGGGGGRSVTTGTAGGNPVRTANQRYFLVPSFKDPTFLKEECELAHAQVTGAGAGKSKATHGKQRCRVGEDNKNNNNQHSSHNSHQNHNNHSSHKAQGHVAGGGLGPEGALNDMPRPPMFNGNQQAAPAGAAATTTTTSSYNRSTINGGHGNGPVHKHGSIRASGTQEQQLTAGQKALQAATASHTGRTLGKLKPLTFGSGSNNNNNSNNNNSNNTNSTSNHSNHNQYQNHGYTSHTIMNGHNNNNSNHSSSVNGSNNNMQRGQKLKQQPQQKQEAQHQLQQQLQDDDISYIDSDDTPFPSTSGAAAAKVAAGSGGAGAATAATEATSTAAANQSDPMFRNVGYHKRPRSTIITSHSNFAASLEKFNNPKLVNGTPSGTGRTTEAGGGQPQSVLSSNARCCQKQRQGQHSGKETTTGYSTSPAGGARGAMPRGTHIAQTSSIGSSGNLQQHRYSGDLENVRLSAGHSSSLTRAAYRTTAPMNCVVAPLPRAVQPVLVAFNPQVNDSKTQSTTAAATTTLATTTSATSATSGTVSASASGSSSSVSTATGTVTVTVTGSAAANDSARNVVSTRNVLPPVSPTPSRYWERDSSNTTSRQYSSSNSSALSGSSKYNTDEGYRSAATQREEKSEGLCGLRNIGNTCFMNSVIQCLSHTTELTRFLRTHHGSRSSATKDQLILFEFAKLIQEMWTSSVHTVTPMDLKRAFSAKHRMYSDYNQQDAQEFLRFFLDSLHSALNSGIKGETLNIDDNLSDNKKADLTWEWYTRHENSLVRDLFVGQLKSTLKCTTCGNTSVTFDPFWDLSVPLPSSSRCKLEACLDLFIREEILDGDEMPTCSKCKTRRKCTKSFTIQRFPKYLVIHLKRFSETRWSKLSNIVEFPTADRDLNMASYGANSNSNVHYSLYAISNHMGSTAGGHYTALCKHPVSRKWHEFNDNIVSDSVSENFLVSSSAYILFYERT
ncbi:ubiquitin carboxyl-terminal hydrolase Usp2 isoform X2 [Drosophila miranda]|uniref:ubiquitin carboxyl-terminal hydrolase Usp2 isoform X2 n=1 Tax=Drosophila miranda TaxID=7229 RepID=UPI0007E71850|nr:ubiquitin carboxyl-terminal hydrolase Usp2 isoform X2 [Drosophila miranda]